MKIIRLLIITSILSLDPTSAPAGSSTENSNAGGGRERLDEGQDTQSRAERRKQHKEDSQKKDCHENKEHCSADSENPTEPDEPKSEPNND